MSKQRIKILFTIPNFTTAGTGKTMVEIIECLDPERYDPTICIEGDGRQMKARLREKGIPLIVRPFTVSARPLAKLPMRVWQTAKPFQREGYDLWHSFHYLDEYTEGLVARAAGAKWVYTKKNMSWGGRAWYVRTFLAHRVIAVNEEMVDLHYAPWWMQHKVRVVPLGIDMEAFTPDRKRILRLREDLGIDRRYSLIGSVGHLVPVKGFEVLIKTLSQLENVQLIIAGNKLDDDYARSLEKLCEELVVESRVHFLGMVHDVSALLAELDIFVLATKAEGRQEAFGLALLEAMAMGLPCIASNLHGPRMMIEHEKSGLLVPPGDVNALEASINRLLNEPKLRRELGNAARKRVEKTFAVKEIARQYEGVYEELI